MSTLYLVPDLFGPPGGIARYCRMVCRALIASGASLTTLALQDQDGAAAEAADVFPTMRYRPCRRRRARFVLEALLALRARPTTILVGHPNFALLGWLLARLSSAQLVVFMYGVEVWAPMTGLRRRALRRADRWIAISRFTARRAAEANHLPLDQIRILHNCLDPHFARREDHAGGAGAEAGLSILTVARITAAERYKGHSSVIRAMPALLARFPGLVYDVVGDGEDRPTLEALAVQEGVARSVRFHGMLPDDELARRYAEASVFVMPSACEGFGFVFIEAMAQGTPAVGGDVDATPEVIVDGETGILVKPDAVDALVAALSRLLADRDLRERMGRAAARHVHRNFGFADFQRHLGAHLGDARAGSAPRSLSGER